MADKKQKSKSEGKVLKAGKLGGIGRGKSLSEVGFGAIEKAENEYKPENEKVKLAKYIILISLIALIILITYIIKITITTIKTTPNSSTEIKYCSPIYNKAFFDCSNNYKPICGDNNKTYDNECMGCYIGKIKYYTDGKCKN